MFGMLVAWFTLLMIIIVCKAIQLHAIEERCEQGIESQEDREYMDDLYQ